MREIQLTVIKRLEAEIIGWFIDTLLQGNNKTFSVTLSPNCKIAFEDDKRNQGLFSAATRYLIPKKNEAY